MADGTEGFGQALRYACSNCEFWEGLPCERPYLKLRTLR